MPLPVVNGNSVCVDIGIGIDPRGFLAEKSDKHQKGSYRSSRVLFPEKGLSP